MKRVDPDPLTQLLKVRFGFRKCEAHLFDETRELVRGLDGTIWSPSLKAWLVPPTYENVQTLWDNKFYFPEDWADDAGGRSVFRKKEKPVWLDIYLPRYLNFLRPYQREAVQFLAYRKGRALIGDDMGIGKTIEALGWIRWTVKRGPALIIVPAITKTQWYSEYNEYVDDYVEVLYGQKPRPLIEDKSYIINWDIIAYWECELEKMDFYTIIADESQNMANKKAKRTRTVTRLSRRIPCYIPMSGTPIETKVKQFFPTLHLVSPTEFPDEWKFLNRYCGPKHNGFSVTFDGISHEQELFQKVNRLMIRRKKRDVLKDMPPVTKTVVPMDITESMKSYKELEAEFFDHLDFGTNLETDKDYCNMKTKLFDLKMKSIVQWIEDFLETGGKLVVGTWFQYVTRVLHEKFPGSVMINGTVTGTKRDQALLDFQGPSQLLFLQMKSGGVGLDGLQKVCSNMALAELPPGPSLLDQFIARVDRSGQKDPVNVYIFLANDTMEEDYLEAMDEVRKNIDAAVDGKKTSNKNLLTFLYEKRIAQ